MRPRTAMPLPPLTGGATGERPMNATLGQNWWVVVARGVLAIVFGLYALFLPGLALDALIMLFGVMVLVAGLLGIIAGVRRQANQQAAVPLIVAGILRVALVVRALIRRFGTPVAAR